MDRAPRTDTTALIVDDDPFILSALAEVLSEDGYDVVTASNGFSAVRHALESRPAVILLDLVLPERSGREVLSELRGNPATRHMGIVVVSGNTHLLTEDDVAEVDAVVPKPFDVSDLLATVHRAVPRAQMRHDQVPPVAAAARRERPVRLRPQSGAPRTRRHR
jgi:DNA-binding response OmpR family regulator